MDKLWRFVLKVYWHIYSHPWRSALVGGPTAVFVFLAWLMEYIQATTGKPADQWLHEKGLPGALTLTVSGLIAAFVLTIIIVIALLRNAHGELQAIRPEFEQLTGAQRDALRRLLPAGRSYSAISEVEKNHLEAICLNTPFLRRDGSEFEVNKDTQKRLSLLLRCDAISRKYWYETPENELTTSDESKLLQANAVNEIAPQQKPKPNIVILGEPRLTPVTHDAEFLFSEELKAVADGRWGIVIEFQNKKIQEEIKSLGGVRSELTFSNKTGTLSHTINPGFWFGPNNTEVDFERGDIHRLFVGFLERLPDTDQSRISTIDRRFTPPEPLTFSHQDSMNVRVTLFTQTRHRFHKECELELTPELRITKPFIETGLNPFPGLFPVPVADIQGEIKEAATNQREETSHNLVLEVIEGPWTRWNGRDGYSDVVIMQDADFQMNAWLLSDIRLRFSNKDVHRTRLETLSLLLIREAPEEPRREIELISHLETEQGVTKTIDTIFVEDREKTIDYYLKADHAELESEWNGKLDEYSFLRIRMEAVGQRPYCVDLDADWDTARKNEAPWEPGRVKVRKVNSC